MISHKYMIANMFALRCRLGNTQSPKLSNYLDGISQSKIHAGRGAHNFPLMQTSCFPAHSSNDRKPPRTLPPATLKTGQVRSYSYHDSLLKLSIITSTHPPHLHPREQHSSHRDTIGYSERTCRRCRRLSPPARSRTHTTSSRPSSRPADRRCGTAARRFCNR